MLLSLAVGHETPQRATRAVSSCHLHVEYSCSRHGSVQVCPTSDESATPLRDVLFQKGEQFSAGFQLVKIQPSCNVRWSHILVKFSLY